MKKLIKPLIFGITLRPILSLILGLNVRHRDRLPKDGPAILIANHNSHLDAIALMSIFGSNILHKVRPVAAADYWYKSKARRWIAKNAIDVIPIDRTNPGGWLDEIRNSLKANCIIIFFPEGSRGEPEEMSEFKGGIAKLAESEPEVPIYPIFMHGFGKALPRGEAVLVPFFCDVFVGKPCTFSGTRESFLVELRGKIEELSKEGSFPEWS